MSFYVLIDNPSMPRGKVASSHANQIDADREADRINFGSCGKVAAWVSTVEPRFYIEALARGRATVQSWHLTREEAVLQASKYRPMRGVVVAVGEKVAP